MFLHTYLPHSILFSFGPVVIHWYGFLIGLAVILSFYIGQKLFQSYKIPANNFYDLGFYLIIFFGIIGARLWHVLSEWDYYRFNLLDSFKIWQGGLAIHGAVLAGLAVIYFYSRQHKLNFWLITDILAPLVILGQAIGRWGNYFNQELYGLPTSLPWGIPIALANRLPGYEAYQFFQPTFLYESLWCFLVFLFLIYLHRQRLKTKKLKYKLFNLPGSIFAFYLILYSLERFLIGFMRLDPMFTWLGLRLDQWTSLVLIVLALIGIYFIFKKEEKKSLFS